MSEQKTPFETWWCHEGSGPPKQGEDLEEFTKRMCAIAWANGAYTAQPAQPEQPEQEPVAWAVYWGHTFAQKHSVHSSQETANMAASEIKSFQTEVRPLYASPQPAPVQQEPVAYLLYKNNRRDSFWFSKGDAYALELTPEHRWEPLYPTPPQRKPLSDDARGHLVIEHLGPNALLHKPMSVFDAFHMGIDATEAAHGIKEKNT